jgi:hypothetical protein
MDKHLEPEDLFVLLAHEPDNNHPTLIPNNKNFWTIVNAPSGRMMSINNETREWFYLSD